MSMDYTKLTHESIVEDWNNRVLADKRYRNLSQASIYSYFQEMFAGVMDMTNYYIQRTAEESYLDTARLDSSVIKLCHNLGYQPRRPIPAVANISINLRGPLPSNVAIGDTIWLNNKTLTFNFNGHDFMLDACYSYKLTDTDVRDGKSPSWTKKIMFAVNGYESQKDGYISLSGVVDSASAAKLHNIRVSQGRVETKILDPITYASKVGKQYQWYDVDDLKFSNYYSFRDPFAYKDGQYEKNYGICKVGIGTDADHAFTPENTFYLEDEAVELNNQVRQKYEGTEEEKAKIPAFPLKVCCIKSNYDKTVRLYFGNGIDTCPGLTSLDQNIYVQYLVTDGTDANYPTAVGSEFKANGRIYASGEGRVTNISNNVSFMFESAIHGGADFESRESMNINAKIYFASNGKLITLPDFMGYFRTLTDPITVRNAIAFGENQLEDVTGEHDAGRTNLIMYSLFGEAYREANGLYKPVNVFDETEDISNSCLYINYNYYMQHLFDYPSFLVYPKGTTDEQYNDNTTFGQWCKRIRDNAADRMMINTKILSLPPLFHYYDVVGNIVVDRHVDMAEFKEELENDLYKWLSENTTFRSKIYKSDLYNQILKNPGAKRANIDIKVSELIKGDVKTYRFSPGEASSNGNILIVPNQDIRGTIMSDILSETVGQDISVVVQSDPEVKSTFRVQEISVDPDSVYLSLNGNPSLDSAYYTDILVEDDSFFTKNRLTSCDYNVIMAVSDWILARPTQNGTDERPVELPYLIEFDPDDANVVKQERNIVSAFQLMLNIYSSVPQYASMIDEWRDKLEQHKAVLAELENAYGQKVIRSETFERAGANSVDINENLSEESFYFAMRDFINKDPEKNFDLMKSNFPYVYPALKQIFDDNILDDNNNIVNFSSCRDIPVLRLRFRYTYA